MTMKKTRLYLFLLILVAVSGLCFFSTSRSIRPVAAAGPQDYVLSAGNWGSQQDQAVQQAGGTVTYSNKKAGIGVVRSDNPNFLTQVMAGNSFNGGAADQVVQWTNPASRS